MTMTVTWLAGAPYLGIQPCCFLTLFIAIFERVIEVDLQLRLVRQPPESLRIHLTAQLNDVLLHFRQLLSFLIQLSDNNAHPQRIT